ncbi:MAG: UDP-3-O-acyl-N-acetylglucosamine deacetylase [Gammaproteobacteria bacterium AqS3]|nr:UDP-3-O-acyl-N-acetylglucosamine deacetylase [Gammaproteobacteria bacterium AqS3]
MLQRTLHNPIKIRGTGLHSGKQILVQLMPAPPDTGIIFRRSDLPDSSPIPAKAANVIDTTLSTTLGNRDEDTRIGTVEHLLSACAGLGMDNLFIDVDGPELPIMDGSASPFIFHMQSAGIALQGREKKFIRINKTIEVRSGDIWARISPHEGFRVCYTLLYDHPVLQRYASTVEVDFSTTTFVKEISRARTFGFAQDLQRLTQQNLALGASERNAIAVGDTGINNPEGLRSDREFAMHKILDCIGDLYLLGHNMIGQFEGYKSGHTINNALLLKLVEEDAFEIISFEDERGCPISLSRGFGGETRANAALAI